MYGLRTRRTLPVARRGAFVDCQAELQLMRLLQLLLQVIVIATDRR